MIFVAFFFFSGFVWILGIRPLVLRHGRGCWAGANLIMAAWVDWQSCCELARGTDNRLARWLARLFLLGQVAMVAGFFLPLVLRTRVW